MNDFGTICCIGGLVLAFFAFMALRSFGGGLSNLLGGLFGGRGGAAPPSGLGQQGSEQPQYDDPDIGSRGSFGSDSGSSTGGMGGFTPRVGVTRESSGGKTSMPPSGNPSSGKSSFSGGSRGSKQSQGDSSSGGSSKKPQGGSLSGGSKPSNSGGRADSPDIDSRGGFGRDK